jgi:hypothetical protein
MSRFLAALRDPYREGALSERELRTESVDAGPLVSIIVRTYGDRRALLRRALQSIVDQAYRPVEILIIDDGGETSPEVLQEFSSVPGCTFRLVATAKLGRSEAANRGLALAEGEFVGFLDDDDFLLPQHLSLLCGMLCGDPALDAVHSASRELAADLDPETGSHGEATVNAVFFRPIANSAELLNRNPFPIQSVLFRRSLLGKQDRFDPNLDALEDWLFWMRLLCGRKIAGAAEVTSVFFVPQSQGAHERRIKAHVAAEPYFVTQRNALYEERRLTDLNLVNAATQRSCEQAISRALQPESQVCEKPALPAGAKRLLSTLVHSGTEFTSEDVSGQTVAFTSINLRYLPKALAWAKSVKAHNPDWQTHILLNDALPESTTSWPNVDRVFPVSDIGIPGFQAWVYGMRVVECCTATKPFYARKLLQAGFQHVFFFDPDTFVYSDLNQLVDEFGDDDVLITPHCSEDAVRDAEIHYNEISSLAHGVFNLGFLGLRNGPNAKAVIDFWCRRLTRHCVDDHARGLFTDQKWFNLVPVFFDGVKILKHRGCNTASWNIASRPISLVDGQYLAGGAPLVFFHFSGYDKNVPRRLFDIFGRFSAPLEKMIDDYDQLNAHYAARFAEWKLEWSLARYSNGELVADEHREIFRSHYQFQLAFDEPFMTGPNSFHSEVTRLGPDGVAALVAPAGYLKRFY